MERVKNLVTKIGKTFDQEIATYQKEVELLVKFKAQFNNFTRDSISSLEPKPILRYHVDSLFLMEAFKCLVATPEEVLRMVTGVALENDLFVLDRLLDVKYEASIVGAKADVKDSFIKLIELDEKFGHKLLSIFHSHPFVGINGTSPSGIDRNLQENLEKSGYRVVQAIFARDGHIRFFSNKLNFEIESYGKGVEKISAKENEAIFRLSEIRG
jgi:hypothetical protein